ncbi:ABC transporter permease [Rhodanobacter hydrolyticus]|uniref:ABC transporter permease n=1 Tax=Rhodanobacter hydrolyticus TaxID=2250595 RepID=A0ABW8J5J0_9GAMM
MNVWLAEVWRAWRASLRRPGFLLLASGVLALGIGANAVAFNLVDQILLKPLPVPQASRLLAVGRLEPRWPPQVSVRQYEALQHLEGVRSIGLQSFVTATLNIAGNGVPQQVAAAYIDHNLLPTMGIQPQFGRNFVAGEDGTQPAPVVLLSHAFWKLRYNGNPDAIGQSLKVEGMPHTIIGVLPETFDATTLNGGDILLPAKLTPDGSGDQLGYVAVASLADGATPAAVGAQVEARLKAVADRSATDRGMHVRYGAMDYQAAKNVQLGTVLVLFQACALLVLLIALVNVTNLLLLRALARHRDIAVRSAMGASSLRMAVPLLGESLLVGLSGAGFGVLLALLGVAILLGILPAEVTGGEMHLGMHTVVLTVLVSLIATLVSAMLGLWRARAISSFDDLREGGRSGGTRYQGRIYSALVIAQVTLAVALLCACGSFLRASWNNAHLRWGFDYTNVATLALSPVRADYPDVQSVTELSRRLVDRMRQLPGVLDVVAATSLPVNDYFSTFGMPAHAQGQMPTYVYYRAVGTDYFRLFGMRLLRGRLFTRDDSKGGEAVAIVSQTAARRMYGGHALGQQVLMDDAAHPGQPWTARIVGVVDDTFPQQGVGRIPSELYVPLAQMADALMTRYRTIGPMHYALRVQGDLASYGEALRAVVAEVAPEQPVAAMGSMREAVAEQLDGTQTGAWISGVFAALAMLLAGTGLYAVMSVAVAAREHELGVRAALGASPMRLATLMLSGGMARIAVGLTLGLILAGVFSRVLSTSFNQLGTDGAFGPWVAGGVCVLLLAFGLLACLVPAIRAGRIQPMRVLQGD